MNKTAIKQFAVTARRTLMQAVTQRAFIYAVTDGGSNDPELTHLADRALTQTECAQRRQLIEHIRQNGFAQTMEEAAYTWFNRFIALRFMEVNGYLPLRIRVFTDECGAFKPEILTEAMRLELEGLEHSRVMALIDAQDNEQLYKTLLIAQCNALNRCLPVMFETIGGWTELLFPDYLLRGDSVIAHLVTDIPEEDWRDQVQIIGWLYQYYNTETKEQIFAALKKNVKISAEALPAATQLFTPDWIVRYMVENSLGRLWAESHGMPEAAHWRYFLPEAAQEPAVTRELESLRERYRGIRPEEIRFLDPCMGSGHVLVYAFDVLMEIYTSCGWSERDAAASILRHNLYGLDIDRRAYQLACFALVMKARQYDRTILRRGGVQLNLACFAGLGTEQLPEGILSAFAGQFRDAERFGSLLEITVPEGLAETALPALPDAQKHALERMLQISRILSEPYDIVVTNPPYMGSSSMTPTLSAFVRQHFPDGKSDLFACFLERGAQLCREGGFHCMVTMQSWMFLSSFERLRRRLLRDNTITCLMQMENMVMGIAFGTAVSCFRRGVLPDYRAACHRIRLNDLENGIPREFPVLDDHFVQISASRLAQLPGMPAAYWVSDAFLRAFEQGTPLGTLADSKQGIATADNKRFLRLWHEVSFGDIKFDAADCEASRLADETWYPYSKGGDYRKWYGNQDYVILWRHDGAVLRKFKRSVIRNAGYFFRECFSWSLISSGAASFRYKAPGQLFDVAGMSCFSDRHLLYLLGLCNSVFAQKVLEIIAPTINYQCGDIAHIPVLFPQAEGAAAQVETLVQENIALCREDWDAFETSWDFRQHPLTLQRKGVTAVGRYIADQYAAWEQECEARFRKLKQNEERLNRIFIDIYGLQDELRPDVADKDVTVRRADRAREVRSLISYAVGCLFGRYSPDVNGLAYAGGVWDATRYRTIQPTPTNILPICDDAYFADDLTSRVIDFMRMIYGEDTLEENLRFIADALGGKGSPREVLRGYLLNGFYADHCRVYQKRPIYWMFSSGRRNGFKALVYMHRWDRTTAAVVRTGYVLELQERYRTQLSLIAAQMPSAAPGERSKLRKQQEKLTAQLTEITAYEERLHPIADQMPVIDLDDGVAVNYARFSDILEPF